MKINARKFPFRSRLFRAQIREVISQIHVDPEPETAGVNVLASDQNCRACIATCENCNAAYMTTIHQAHEII